MHGGWPLGLIILALSSGFAVFFGFRRNLPANVFMHFLLMCLALFVVPLMQRQGP
jgi:hypothetical protein